MKYNIHIFFDIEYIKWSWSESIVGYFSILPVHSDAVEDDGEADVEVEEDKANNNSNPSRISRLVSR